MAAPLLHRLYDIVVPTTSYPSICCAPEMLESQIALMEWYKRTPLQNGMFNKPETITVIAKVAMHGVRQT